MAVFDWCQPGREIIKVKFEWNVQVPSLLSQQESKGEYLESSFFSAEETPERLWQLQLFNQSNYLGIYAYHFNLTHRVVDIGHPSVLVKFAIVNRRGQKIHQQMVPSQADLYFVHFDLPKEDIRRSDCVQPDGSLTIFCKILSFEENVKIFRGGIQSKGNGQHVESYPVDCIDELATQLEGLFDDKKLSDVTFSVRRREFKAHKAILASRSQVFEAMFKHPTKENKTNHIVIEDIEPDVFHELLRFIYAGRVPLTKMENFAAGLLFAADKYLLDLLKRSCEKYLIRRMSVDNSLELLLLHHHNCPVNEHLKKEAIKFFRLHPGKVMATDKWKKTKQENPILLCNIQEMVLCCSDE